MELNLNNSDYLKSVFSEKEIERLDRAIAKAHDQEEDRIPLLSKQYLYLFSTSPQDASYDFYKYKDEVFAIGKTFNQSMFKRTLKSVWNITSYLRGSDQGPTLQYVKDLNEKAKKILEQFSKPNVQGLQDEWKASSDTEETSSDSDNENESYDEYGDSDSEGEVPETKKSEDDLQWDQTIAEMEQVEMDESDLFDPPLETGEPLDQGGLKKWVQWMGKTPVLNPKAYGTQSFKDLVKLRELTKLALYSSQASTVLNKMANRHIKIGREWSDVADTAKQVSEEAKKILQENGLRI